MKMSDIEAWRLVKKTAMSWKQDYAQSMGAALAFYTMFSVAPLLMVAIALAGYFFGAAGAKGEINTQIAGLMGSDAANAIQALLSSTSSPAHRSITASIGVVIFLVGATSVFNELQDSLNRIWRVRGKRHKSGLLAYLRARLLSLGMIFGIALLLLVSILVSTVLSAMMKSSASVSMEWQFAAQFLDLFVSFALIAVMFAVVFKVVPQIALDWGDVWIGAATTSALFTIGKQLIGIYLGRRVAVSGLGTVGSVAVFLLWVYYSAQIFLLGAEFTCILSKTRGSRTDSPMRGSPSGSGGA